MSSLFYPKIIFILPKLCKFYKMHIRTVQKFLLFGNNKYIVVVRISSTLNQLELWIQLDGKIYKPSITNFKMSGYIPN